MRTFSIALILISLSAMPPSWVRAEETRESACLGSRIEYDTSTLEKLVHTPSVVLQDEESFWKNEKAQHYTQVWADNVNFEISRKDWRRQVSELGGMTAEQRDDSPVVRITGSIVGEREAFLAQAIPHVCSYLPETVKLDIPVHFTAFIPPRSMVTGGIVVNVGADYWKNDPDNILNNLTHEIFHVGYSHLRNERVETPLANEALYGFLDTLQNEGIATWIGYEARSIFPAPDELDYRMLEDPDEVTRLIGEVNAIIAMVGITEEDELRRASWNRGVEGRAYYIAGAHMAGTIQSKLGRPTLIESILEGPVGFVTLYNSLVDDAREIDLEVDARQTTANRPRSARGLKLAATGFLGSVMLGFAFLGWRHLRARR